MRKPVFNKKYPKATIANERGVILVTVVLLLLILGLLIFTATQWAQMDIKRTKDYTKTREAFYIAETGIQRALNFLNFDASGDPPGAAWQPPALPGAPRGGKGRPGRRP